MREESAAVTVFNYYQNRRTGKEEWRRTVLSGERMGGGPAIWWEDSRGVSALVTAARAGLWKDDEATVLIWFAADAQGRLFIPARAYGRLEPVDADRFWTLTPGRDRIVRGVAPGNVSFAEIGGGAVVDKPCGAAGISGNFSFAETMITVASVRRWDCGDIGMRHFEVIGR